MSNPEASGDSPGVDTAHVGPIIFGNETARSQLVDEGEVVTFRATERTTGDTWWRETRTGPKRGDVRVELINPAEPKRSALKPFARKSGFDSWREWQDAIEEVHGDPSSGYLYRVTAQEGQENA